VCDAAPSCAMRRHRVRCAARVAATAHAAARMRRTRASAQRTRRSARRHRRRLIASLPPHPTAASHHRRLTPPPPHPTALVAAAVRGVRDTSVRSRSDAAISDDEQRREHHQAPCRGQLMHGSSDIAHALPPHGYPRTPTPWAPHGYPMGTPWVPHGYPMGTPWVPHGCAQGTRWGVLQGTLTAEHSAAPSCSVCHPICCAAANPAVLPPHMLCCCHPICCAATPRSGCNTRRKRQTALS
jgi:hypothetical protein